MTLCISAVVMPTTTYTEKANNILSDGSCRKLKKDPTCKVEIQINDKLKEVERSGEITSLQRKRLLPRQSTPPHFYGTPNIHKEGIPLIVSTIGSAMYWLAKELACILSPLMGKTDSYIAKLSTLFAMH